MDRISRIVATVITGVVAFIGSFAFLVPAGCADVGGVPSWERCTSLMGTPAVSPSEEFGLPVLVDLLIPLAIAGGLAWLIWWALGLPGRSSEDREAPRQR